MAQWNTVFRRGLAMSAAAGPVLFAAPALADTAAEAAAVAHTSAQSEVGLGASAQPTVGSAPSDRENAGNSFESTEIVVTAQKRTESAQTVPSSISVLNGAALERANATQLADYANYVPGLNLVGRGTPGTSTLILRGIYGGIGAGGATVGVYVDDAPFGSSSAYGPSAALDLLPYDLQRIEVLRGPQGTLYGAGSMGGLLKYVTVAPSLNSIEGRAGGEVFGIKGGDQAGWAVRAGLNVPIITDELAVRASFYYRDNPGYIDNPATGEEDQNDGYQSGGRLSLLWAPTNDLRINLVALHQKLNYDGVAAVTVSTLSGEPAFGDLTKNNRVQESARQSLYYYAGTVSWDITNGINFVSSSSYSRQNNSSVADGSAFFFPVFGVLAGFDGQSRIRKFTQEFRLSSRPSTGLEWLVGAFYTKEKSDAANIGTPYDTSGAVVSALNPILDSSRPSEYNELAAFADLTYHISDRWDISAGGRYSRNRQNFDQITGGFLSNPADPSARVVTPGRSSDEVFTYSLSTRFRPAPDMMLYARVASGYRPGGPNVALPGIPASFAADTLTNYELGFKSRLFDRRVLFDISAFYIDWNDIQISVQSPSLLTYFANGGKARSKGIEFTTSFAVTDRFNVNFNAAYTDAKLSDDVPSLRAVAGDRLPSVAKWSAALTADYAIPIGDRNAHLSASYRYLSGREYTFPADPSNVHFKPYGIVDLNLSVPLDRFTVSVYAKNLTDKRAYLALGTLGPGITNLTVYQPRTIGLALELKY